jgi:hypothetical protein
MDAGVMGKDRLEDDVGRIDEGWILLFLFNGFIKEVYRIKVYTIAQSG